MAIQNYETKSYQNICLILKYSLEGVYQSQVPVTESVVKKSNFATRRVRGDLLEVFQIINGLGSIFPVDIFIVENEHDKISKLHSRVDVRIYSVTQMIGIDFLETQLCLQA